MPLGVLTHLRHFVATNVAQLLFQLVLPLVNSNTSSRRISLCSSTILLPFTFLPRASIVYHQSSASDKRRKVSKTLSLPAKSYPESRCHKVQHNTILAFESHHRRIGRVDDQENLQMNYNWLVN